MKELILGIIGGLGPAATVYFMDLVTRMTTASRDSEHLEMLVHSMPSIPDRTEYILGKSSDSPVPHMIQVGQGLVRQGADIIAIPCMTAHAFHNELQGNITVPVLNGIVLTANAVHHAGAKKVGIMATDGTVKSKLFRKEFEHLGVDTVYLSEKGQERVMSLIYDDIKAGLTPNMDKFRAIKEEFSEKGAGCIVLGCTELSIIKRDMNIGSGFADTMEIIAWHSVKECKKKPSVEYSSLVTLADA